MPLNPRYTLVKEIFAAALDLPSEQRPAFVRERARGGSELEREVLELLSLESRAENRLDTPLALRMETPRVIEDEAGLPPKIDGFVIAEFLGKGGMGLVWRAMQETPRREVALKILRSREGAAGEVAILDREIRALARLEHAGIARLYAAGRLDGEGGSPWFAMELVRGAPLSPPATRGGDDLRRFVEKLGLVAEAVHHAHLRGILHLDLKPANILVGRDGTPKIVDFGISRAAEDAEDLGDRGSGFAGTLPYMSPERLRGNPAEVDARSDVYGLGMTAFELLAGAWPFAIDGLPLVEAVRRITEEPRRGLRALVPAIPRDLAAVVEKAIEPEAGRRYPSMAAMADDLRAFVESRPGRAGALTPLALLASLGRRRPATVALAGIALLLGLAGLAAAVRQTILATRSERIATESKRSLEAALALAETRRRDAEAASMRARHAAETATAITSFFERVIDAATPLRTGGEDITLRAALAEISDLLGAAVGDPPGARGALHLAAGRTWMSLADLRRSRHHLEQARDAFRELGDSGTNDLALAERELAWCHLQDQRLDDAEASLARARDALRGTAAPPSTTAWLDLSSAEILTRRGRPDEAATILDAAIRRLRAEAPEETEILSAVHNALGNNALERGSIESALAHYRDSLRLAASTGMRSVDDTSVSNLGLALLEAGRAEEAAVAFSRAAEIATRHFGARHARTLRAEMLLARALGRAGRHDEALELFDDRLPELRRRARPPELRTALHDAGVSCQAVGRQEDAVLRLEEASALPTEPGDELSKAITAYELGRVRLRLGDAERALGAHESAVLGLEAGTMRHAMVEGLLGICLARLGRHQEARTHLESALPVVERELGPDAPAARDIRRQLVAVPPAEPGR